jgi:hypothetical protein
MGVKASKIVERLNETTLWSYEGHLQILGIIMRLDELKDACSIKTAYKIKNRYI